MPEKESSGRKRVKKASKDEANFSLYNPSILTKFKIYANIIDSNKE
ncbi:MAG: hypothetical protein NT116_00825 [Candidatus Parcubacteria bacterium]|nr:hypothetical protein [Candidatus Parcubacteria bacterium]